MQIIAEEKLMHRTMKAIYDSGIPIDFRSGKREIKRGGKKAERKNEEIKKYDSRQKVIRKRIIKKRVRKEKRCGKRSGKIEAQETKK